MQKLKVETTNYPIRSNNTTLRAEKTGDVYKIILSEGDKCSFPVINPDPILINNEPYDVEVVGDYFRPALPPTISHSVQVKVDPKTDFYILTIGNLKEEKKNEQQ